MGRSTSPTALVEETPRPPEEVVGPVLEQPRVISQPPAAPSNGAAPAPPTLTITPVQKQDVLDRIDERDMRHLVLPDLIQKFNLWAASGDRKRGEAFSTDCRLPNNGKALEIIRGAMSTAGWTVEFTDPVNRPSTHPEGHHAANKAEFWYQVAITI